MAHRRTFSSDFRKFFIKGLGILLPTILTLWILWTAFQFVFNNVAQPINKGIRAGVVWAVPEFVPQGNLPQWARVSDGDVAAWRASPEGLPTEEVSDARARTLIGRKRLREFWNENWWMQGVGLAAAIILIYLAGVLLGGLIGRRMYARIERFLAKVPGFKQVYPHVKQLVDLIMGERPLAFNRVVLVEYPRKGIWTVGFVTGNSMRIVHETAGRACLSIFVPSTPAPFTGFTISVPEEETVDLPISIEEAIRFFVSGGVLVPPGQAPVLASGKGAPAELPSPAVGTPERS
jgi:uncharacterized membrane protein